MAHMSFAPVDVKAFNLQKTFKGHTMSVSNLALHPTKPIVVSNTAAASELGLVSCRLGWDCTTARTLAAYTNRPPPP